MADNSTIPGGDVIRDKDRAGIKTQIFGLDLGIGTGAESLMNGSMPITLPASLVSTVNSTTAVLAGGAVFTGTSEEVKDYATIQVAVITSHASATDGLSIQQSSDGTNWDFLDTYTIPAVTGKAFSFQPTARYMRVVYTNGATLQTSFRLQTIYHPTFIKASSQRPQDAYTNETDTEQVWAFGSLWNPSTGLWDRAVQAGTGKTTSGSITTQNLVPAGAATAGSAVASAALNDEAACMVQVTGTYTGVLSIQGTVDGTNWVTVFSGITVIAMSTASYSATIPSNTPDIYRITVAGFTQVRITGLAAVTGTAVVTIRVSAATSMVAMSQALPPGSATVNIGGVTNTPATPTEHLLSSAATTNLTSVKASSGKVYSIVLSNVGAAVCFFKLYNKASAPVVASDVPIMIISIPANGVLFALDVGALGHLLSTGIAYAITNLIAVADATAVAAAQVKVMMAYI